MRRLASLTLGLVLALVAGACADEQGPLVVGALDDGTGDVVAELYVALLEANGIDAERSEAPESRPELVAAVESGEVDLYPEYSGDGLDFLAGRQEAVPEVAPTASALRRLFLRRGVEVFDPGEAQRRLGVAVTFETAERTRIYTVSGLAGLEERVALAVPPGCEEAPRCLPGLRTVYGLEPDDVVEAADPEAALQALHDGEVDAAVVPETEGALGASDDVVLVDDRALQPAQSVIPVVRRGAWEPREEIYRAFDRLSEELTTADVRELDRRVDQEGEDPAEVARDLIEDKGLI